MSHSNTVLSQILHLVPKEKFNSIVKKYNAEAYVKHFKCWNQMAVMFYSQASGKDSLRDIENALKFHGNKLYHLGIKKVARSTFADTNSRVPFNVYKELFYKLLSNFKEYSPKHKFRFKNPLYSMDSSTIELCLSLFDWAKFRKQKGAVKLHCLLNNAGNIPEFITLTTGKCHDINVARELELTPDSIISFDKAYIDYKWLYSFNKKGAYFVTRAKRNMNYEVTGQQKLPHRKGLTLDYKIRLKGIYSKYDYPDEMRMVGYIDQKTEKEYIFITNNFKLSAKTIADIYKSRWQIEIFFKWIKQNLEIKTFLGTSQNAVMTQIWAAMCYYMILAYVKYKSKYSCTMREWHNIIHDFILYKISVINLMSMNFQTLKKATNTAAQLELF